MPSADRTKNLDAQIRVRCFGGFEVLAGDRPLGGFESQKARGLLAYLICHRPRTFSRNALAGLLWPELSETAARHALRQAIYNVRGTLRNEGGIVDAFHTDKTLLGVSPDFELWLDVEAFENEIKLGSAIESRPDPHRLVRAAKTYRGDFLMDFAVSGCPEFEDWMIAEQERLRDVMVSALQRLVESYLSRAEYRLGIHYARQLVSMEPYSEEAHRQLMRLLARSGRRSRALAQFEQLRNLLAEELGVQPLEETTALYESLLEQETPDEPEFPLPESLGPLIPLVGRSEQTRRLEELWGAVGRQGPHVTFVAGEAGAGKSRLVKTFLDGATSRRRTVVLTGRAQESAPLIAYGLFRDLLASAFVDYLIEEEGLSDALSPATIDSLLAIAPALDLPGGPRDPAPGSPIALEELGRAVRDLLEYLVYGYESGTETPVVLFLEDLQWADRASLELLQHLLRQSDRLPLWFLITRRSGGGTDGLLEEWSADVVEVPRLSFEQVDQIACSMVELAGAGALTALLWSGSDGLPFTVAELINFCWDEGVLVHERGTWRLDPDTLERAAPPADLNELVQTRLRRLPASARRLLAQAAVIGEQFDVQTLREVSDEHPKVIEIALELMIERWLVRQHPRAWSTSGRQRDLVLWARGARRGWFEFAHRQIRDSVLASVNPLRRRVMHGQVARLLRRRHAGDLGHACEEIAFHELAAAELDEIEPMLDLAARKAKRRGASEVADWYRRQAQEVAGRRRGKVRSIAGGGKGKDGRQSS